MSRSNAISLELPSDVNDLPTLRRLLNERLRRIEEELEGPDQLSGDLDAKGFRIVNVGAPKEGKDALNLNEAERRFRTSKSSSSSTTSTVTTRTVAGDVDQVLVLSVPGTLGIRSNIAPLVSLAADRRAVEIVALLKQGPIGGDLVVKVEVAGRAWASITVAAGQVEARIAASQLSAIQKNALIVSHITAVGLTFPGADLSILIRLGN